MQKRAEYLGYGLCAVTPEKIPEKWCASRARARARTHHRARAPPKLTPPPPPAAAAEVSESSTRWVGGV